MLIVALAIVFLGGTFAILNDYYSYDKVSERLLSQFADPKEEYGMLLEGRATYQGDTVVFNFIPGVSFPIDQSEKDRIVVKSHGESVEFFRCMINLWSVPDPTGDGKAMGSWWTKADYYPTGIPQLLAKEKKFFQIFKKVVENGKIAYDGFETEKALTKNFQQTYSKNPADAQKLAQKVMNPLF